MFQGHLAVNQRVSGSSPEGGALKSSGYEVNLVNAL
jgi:hypothetical protein